MIITEFSLILYYSIRLHKLFTVMIQHDSLDASTEWVIEMVVDGLLAHHNKGACNVAAWVPSLLVWGWDSNTASPRHDEHDNYIRHQEGIQLKQTIHNI